MAGTTGRRWKCRGRPCSECGRWFEADPRLGRRQVTCGEACSRTRHLQACKKWREANAVEAREDRLRRRLRAAAGARGPGKVAPVAQIHWEVVRDEMTPEACVIIEEVVQVLVAWVRDEMVGQVLDT